MCSCRWKSCWFDSSGTLSQRLAATDLNHNDAHTNPQEVVCLRVRACFSWSRFHHVFLLFWLHSSEQLHFKSTSFLGGSCLTPRVFFGHCGSQLSQNAFHTPPAAEWRCFVFPSRDCRSISEDSSSCRAEFRASTFTLRINQIDPVNRIRADWYSVNRHNLRAWARVSVLQVQCDRY